MSHVRLPLKGVALQLHLRVSRYTVQLWSRAGQSRTFVYVYAFCVLFPDLSPQLPYHLCKNGKHGTSFCNEAARNYALEGS